MDNLFAHVFLGGHLFFFGLIILFGLFWEFFKFFLQIGMILIPLRVVFIILVPFHLENFFRQNFLFFRKSFLFGIRNFTNRCNYYAIFRTNFQNIFLNILCVFQGLDMWQKYHQRLSKKYVHAILFKFFIIKVNLWCIFLLHSHKQRVI